jgi:hypothetical protein
LRHCVKISATAATRLMKIFLVLLWDFEDLIGVNYEFRPWNKLDSGVVREKSCFAIKGDSLQIRRKYNNANVIFYRRAVPSIQE